jgi:hypothetical protein
MVQDCDFVLSLIIALNLPEQILASVSSLTDDHQHRKVGYPLLGQTMPKMIEEIEILPRLNGAHAQNEFSGSQIRKLTWWPRQLGGNQIGSKLHDCDVPADTPVLAGVVQDIRLRRLGNSDY